MKRKLLLVVALVLTTAALIGPPSGNADCEPQGTYGFRTAHCEANAFARNGDGGWISCGPPPEYCWCDYGVYNPPPCCNGYHIEEDPYDDGICFYCRYEWYVCD